MTETKAVDAAEAAQGAGDVAGPEVADEFSPAAIRDICRRVAYDMGIASHEVHPEMLPAIAAEAAKRMKAEVAGNGAARRSIPGHVAPMDVLAGLTRADGKGWVMSYNGREFRHADGASFSYGQDAETITIHFCRPIPSTVETIHLDRQTSTAGRIAGVIAALLVQD